jgi:phage replication-related protein YjqB (UPF0714/DUF867 family)
MPSGWKLWSRSARSTTPGDIMLSKDFKEFIGFLNKNDVRYLIVGGYAVAFHGYPRYTRDLDVWIELSPENAANVIEALEKFGFGALQIKKEDFLEHEQIIQLGYPPNRIDILTSLHGVQFEKCYKSRIEFELADIVVNFIDVENLKRNKIATGRLQDLADVENL